MTHYRRHFFAGLAFYWAIGGVGISAQDTARFPFVIPGFDASTTVTDLSGLSKPVTENDGFVRIQDGHFANDEGRLRIWGVNFSFGANFPSHEDAEKAAAHLAKIGVNGVRIHHHESQPSPGGMFKKNGEWDPNQIDKLDYFIDQLNRNGIYVNLNLHVGRSVGRQLGLPPLGNDHAIAGDKHTLHFNQKVQNAFFEYCREMLNHVNPYRKLKRSEDPGIAMLEIANENKFSLFGTGALLSAPEPHRSEAKRSWNEWLKATYVTTAAASAAMKPEVQGGSAAITIASSSEWTQEGLGRWRLNDGNGKSPVESQLRDDGKADNDTGDGGKVLRLVPKVKPENPWSQQFGCYEFSVTKDKTYIVRFDIRSDRPRPLPLNAASVVGEWHTIGLVTTVEATSEWKSHAYRFVPQESVDQGAILTFDLGGDQTPIELRNMELVEGNSAVVIPEGQSIEAGNVDLPSVQSAPKVLAAFRQFMYDTEVAFYTKTKKLLREELNVRVPITTTQVNYQPPSITDQVADYADMHAYWHHPTFPGRGWDPDNWHVQNETLVAYPFHNSWPRCNLLMRTPWRLFDKPFTFSEWNTGEPGFFSADAIPIAALLASLQDWDAVFFYNYHNSTGDWDRDRLDRYFDINGQPTKVALLSALANLYRRSDLAPLTKRIVVSEFGQANVGANGISHLVGTNPNLAAEKSHPSVEFDKLQQKESKLLMSPDKSVVWDARDETAAHVLINTSKTVLVWGLVANKSLEIGPLQFDFGDCERDFAIVVVTSRDDLPLTESKQILVTALANAENQEMPWNDERTTVGSNWGHGPTMANGIPVKIQLTRQGKPLECHALDGTGKRTVQVPGNENTFELGPKHKTLWYELSTD